MYTCRAKRLKWLEAMSGSSGESGDCSARVHDTRTWIPCSYCMSGPRAESFWRNRLVIWEDDLGVKVMLNFPQYVQCLKLKLHHATPYADVSCPSYSVSPRGGDRLPSCNPGAENRNVSGYHHGSHAVGEAEKGPELRHRWTYLFLVLRCVSVWFWRREGEEHTHVL